MKEYRLKKQGCQITSRYQEVQVVKEEGVEKIGGREQIGEG